MACFLARSVGSALEGHRQWLIPPASHPREVRVEVYPRKKRWKRPLQDAAGAKGIPPTGFSVVRFSAALIKGPRIGLTLELASPAPVQFALSQNKAVPTPCHPRGVPKVPAPQGFIIWASSLCLMTLVQSTEFAISASQSFSHDERDIAARSHRVRRNNSQRIPPSLSW